MAKEINTIWPYSFDAIVPNNIDNNKYLLLGITICYNEIIYFNQFYLFIRYLSTLIELAFFDKRETIATEICRY